MEDERELDWWPMSHERYEEVKEIVSRLNLSDEAVRDLLEWASVPAEMVKAPHIALGASRGVRLVDYDKLYRELERRAGA